MTKQKYQYRVERSILYGLTDDYEINQKEYYLLYSFFVTYSLGDDQSNKGRKLSDYGWTGDYSRNGLKDELQKIIDLYDNSFYSFADDDNSGADDFFKNECNRLNLGDGSITNLSYERAAISNTKGTNKYLKLFYRIRDGFAHGRFLLRIESGKRMIVIQDNDSNNVTARIVLNIDNLFKIINVIDKNKIL